MTEQNFKYVRESFGDLLVRLHHLTIYLNFLEGAVVGSNSLEMEALVPMDEVMLDARDLEILKVEWLPGHEDGENGAQILGYTYLQDRNKLVVRLPRSVEKGERFTVRTFTKCVPTDHILEGIYKDVTPSGAPQQYMSQCQQWGFQRIMPIIDDCRAKCTMTTTIEADAAYTHLVSNGNISRDRNPDRAPIPKPEDPARQIITYENSIPMAPYLFIVAVGTWDTLEDTVTYDSGRTVKLEYLVPPGRMEGARIPMEILKRSVLWIKETQGYEYTGDTYRTICMTKSNFGGMENVGNTTIVTDAALVDEHTLDQSLIYSHAVIVHEFEHNQCGSETTMATPFDVWLNEAFTVDVERQFTEQVFDPTFMRLTQVDSIRNPLLGPLAIEDGGRAGRIVREGFDDPDDLIDGVTYVKAAEVIRMLRLVIGTENFVRAKDLYFSKYRHSNADTDQFFDCFEEICGRSLAHFKESWLYTMGYPRVEALTKYDPKEQSFSIQFRQVQEEHLPAFHIPIDLGLVDRNGKIVSGSERVFQLQERQAEIVIDNVPDEPSFASLNRDYSFYGTFTWTNATTQQLAHQVLHDPNAFNRVEAFRHITDLERVKLLEDPESEISRQWVDLYGEILADRNLPPGLKGYFLRIEEQPLDRNYSTWFPELVLAKEALVRAVNSAYRDKLEEQFLALDTYRERTSPNDGIEDRILKHVLLELTTFDNTPESHRLILNHHDAATTIADRVSALLLLNRSSASERGERLTTAYQEWNSHLSGYANYLRIVSSGTCDDVFHMIQTEKNRPTFDITQPTWSRALFLPMAANNKMLWTDRGIHWLTDTVIELSSVNPYTTGRLLNAFQHARRLKPGLQEKVIAALERIVESVSQEANPSVHGQARAYLGV